MATQESINKQKINRLNKVLGVNNDTIITKNKQELRDSYILQMLNRTQEIFKYSNLPDTINEKYLEQYLQVNGYSIIAEVDNKLYAFTGGLYGVGVYYEPTQATITNVALNITKDLKIGKECIVIKNDSYKTGILDICKRYAELLTEVDISMRMATINTRAQFFIVTTNDTLKESADKFLTDLENGVLGALASQEFLDGIKQNIYTTINNDNIKNLIELKQYLWSCWFIELGLNSNFNMKREALNSAETEVNNDILQPLIDNMLKCRRIAIEEINKLYGTNISVELNSSWINEHINHQAEVPEQKEVNENE